MKRLENESRIWSIEGVAARAYAQPLRSWYLCLGHLQGDKLMVSSHVNALEVKHQGFDRKIKEEMLRPSPDGVAVQMLKKKKLRIKEELSHI